MLNINELGLSEPLLKAVQEMGFEKPMPIQEQAIPFLIESDRDLIGLAATGTGKTAAFGLPLLQKIDSNDRSIQALILCPTRELCRQITKELENFGKFLRKIDIVAVYGGAPIGKQISAIRYGAQVIVATPGRIRDLQKRGAADLSSIKMLVLDEADEMLNMGFEEELREILAVTPKEKQTALFSATLSHRIAGIAAGYLHDPHEISVGKKNVAAANVDHSYYIVHPSDRYSALRMILDYNPNFYGIVFCRTRQNAGDIAGKLAGDGYGAEALHGEIAQSQRDTIMARFRAGTSRILIATDVAARGIDIDDLTHVVHYELPDDSASYIHRSGRTGRVNKEGVSIAILSSGEKRKIPMLERMIKKTIELHELPSFQEIIMKRLVSLAENAKKSGSVTTLLDDQLNEYMEVFKDLDRESLIRSLISSSVMPLIAYYQNMPPLKPSYSPKKTGRREVMSLHSRSDRGRGAERGRGSDRGHSDHGHSDRGHSDRGHSDRGHSDRGGRGGRSFEFDHQSARKGVGKPSRAVRRREGGSPSNYSRFFVSMGKMDGIQPKDIIGFVNQTTGNRSIPIGSIEIKGAFSFFEVDSQYKNEVLSKSNGAEFKKRKIKVEEVNS